MGKEEDITILKAADVILRRHAIYSVAISMLILDLKTERVDYVGEIP